MTQGYCTIAFYKFVLITNGTKVIKEVGRQTNARVGTHLSNTNTGNGSDDWLSSRAGYGVDSFPDAKQAKLRHATRRDLVRTPSTHVCFA